MKSRAITKEELVQLFKMGTVRKKEEHEIFVLCALQNPQRSDIYSALERYVEFEYRYYDLALHYYSGDFDYFDNGLNEDLLVLTEEASCPLTCMQNIFVKSTPRSVITKRSRMVIL